MRNILRYCIDPRATLRMIFFSPRSVFGLIFKFLKSLISTRQPKTESGHSQMNALLRRSSSIIRNIELSCARWGVTIRRCSTGSASNLSDLIPVVDVKSFYDSTSSAYDIAKQISKSLHETGFVYIKNSPLTDGIINNCIGTARIFFNQSQIFKNQIRTTDTDSFGYYHYKGVGNTYRQ